LLYRVVDEKGDRVGTPIKASGIWFKPTFPYLEKRFAENKVARQPHRQRLMTAIDWALHGRKLSLDELAEVLRKEQVTLVIRQNKDGVVYGLTYIDKKTQCVFNGSDLGRAYSANAVMERLRQDEAGISIRESLARVIDAPQPEGGSVLTSKKHVSQEGDNHAPENSDPGKLVAGFIAPDREGTGYTPWQLKKKKRKKKGRSV
jgi:hypothetical protein